MVPVPPAETRFAGSLAASWHLAGVGPVVTSDVVEESQPARAIATVAKSAGRTDGCLQCIEVLQRISCVVGFVHTVRHQSVEVFSSIRTAAIAARAGSLVKFSHTG